MACELTGASMGFMFAVSLPEDLLSLLNSFLKKFMGILDINQPHPRLIYPTHRLIPLRTQYPTKKLAPIADTSPATSPHLMLIW